MAPHRTRASDPVQCPICDKTISRKADLNRHVKTHSENEEDKHHCTVEGCMFSAVQRSALKTHMNRHSGERPHECPVENCPFTTPDPGNLTRHRIEQHAYVPLTRTRSSDDQESEGVSEPAPPARRRRRTRRNTSHSTPQSASSPSDSPSGSSSSLSLTDAQAQQGSNITSATYGPQPSSGSVSSWDTHSPASLSPASDLVEGNQLASASPYSAEAIINNFARAGTQPWDILPPLSLSPNFYQGHSSNVVTHFAQVAPQSQSPIGSSSSWDPSLPSLLFADEHVAPIGHSHFASTASQGPMTQHPMPEQGYPYAMVPAAPLFPTIDRSATEEAWNESYAATPSVSMPTTSYGAGNSLVSAPTTLPPYSVRNVGVLTPADIPRYGNHYHVGNMLPPASTSSTSYGNQYNVGNIPPSVSTSSTWYGNQYNVGNIPPTSTSSTSYGVQYPINYASDGFYGQAVGNMLPPASTSSTSYGAQYPTNHTSYGNHGHTANAMSFGAQITHQQTNGSFVNPNMNGYSQATYPQAGGQGYLHTTHAGTSGFRKNGFSPY